VREWDTVDSFVVLICFELAFVGCSSLQLLLLVCIGITNLQGESICPIADSLVVEGVDDLVTNLLRLEAGSFMSAEQFKSGIRKVRLTGQIRPHG